MPSVSRFHGGLEDTAEALARFAGLGVGELQNRCAVYFDEGAVAHTFAVAAGLDSVVVGESQVLGQVRAALTQAQGHGTVGTVLNSLFQQAIRVGKRVHTETSVGAAGRSLVTAAYDVLSGQIGGLAGRQVLVIGAGSMATLAARTAAGSGAAVTCLNRTYARAHRLATSFGGRALPWSELRSAIGTSDVLVSCTGARELLITKDELRGTAVRGVVDLALPADVAGDVTELGVELVNLARLIEDTARLRQRAADRGCASAGPLRGRGLPRSAARGDGRADRGRSPLDGLGGGGRRDAPARPSAARTVGAGARGGAPQRAARRREASARTDCAGPRAGGRLRRRRLRGRVA